MELLTIIGYDKDNDVYMDYGTFDYFSEALHHATILFGLMKQDKLTRTNGEPIDWIEIYRNFGKDNEEKIWASYDN